MRMSNTASTEKSTPSPATVSRLLTEHEAAELLSIPVKTLQDKRYRGGGCPYVKIGRTVRYRREDLAAFIETGRRAHTSEAGR